LSCWDRFTDGQILSLHNRLARLPLSRSSDRPALIARTQMLLADYGLSASDVCTGKQLYEHLGVYVYVAGVAPRVKMALDEDAVILLLATSNPKMGLAHERFALYESGMTVRDYFEACREIQGEAGVGRAKDDLHYDEQRDLIAIVHPETGEIFTRGGKIIQRKNQFGSWDGVADHVAPLVIDAEVIADENDAS